ncbi:lipoprotein [Haemophilus paraphrohaemolyticus]|uniref:Lipoprotein n=1 Tax=Haemophilus paraphrohaemolyticus HK411 TaxID=1095743 RepID=I2NID9_9PAST|nr:lipoprotein [Haemophilus paraphrohaemolyticus]EIG25600.1 hypothetical protein HMPREF1054_1806 [Haemophilus paraphrohaemolyticus HK411]OOR95231.1 hypothetical protein B0184_04530 [Haemophilus paraphrohaemolyticus]STP00779.1 Uncharacterised protein [Haemophilus paraphrohaemolyticus]
MKKIIPVLFSVFLLSGCFGIHSLEEPTLVSTRNYEFTNKNLQPGKQVVVNLKNYGYSAYQEAINDAISRNSCTVALINVKSSNNGRTIEDTEVIDPTLGNCAK